MRLAWITDPHFDHCDKGWADSLFASLLEADPDGVLLGGDIAEGENLLPALERFAEELSCPTWFVLGNHDYYRGAFLPVEEAVAGLCRRQKHLHWLRGDRVMPLTRHSALIGEGGWGDGRHGDFPGSPLTQVVADFHCIPELQARRNDLPGLQERVEQLGREAAGRLEAGLNHALERFPRVLILTHVPPFPQASWYRRRHSNPEGTPHFCWISGGETINRALDRHPGRGITVLCGHTHNEGSFTPRPELTVLTGGAQYGKPRITGMLEIE